MTGDTTDNGISVNGLWGLAWLLGLVAAGSLLRLLVYAGDGSPVSAELFVWVLLGVVASAFAACCATLAGVKSAEQRLAHRLAGDR